MKYLINIVLILLTISLETTANNGSETTKKAYSIEALTDQKAPEIDGRLDDVSWEKASWEGDFKQFRPNNGEAPSQETKFKVLYDDKFLYLGIRCYDTDPSKIEQRLSRRDGFEGDWINVNIDSYHDLQTSFSFTVTAAGVKGDEMLTGDGNNSDVSWNPIWYTKTQIDGEGWTAEMKIPFSQLRFDNGDEKVWGFQIRRSIFRENETSVWQHTPIDAAGFVSSFGELHGIKNLKGKRQLEVQPYVVTQLDTYEKEEGNPFRDGKDATVTAGVDGKIGITNNLSLDFTINPDFGQVEADPAAIALDGFQIFNREQRPFFVENKNIYDFNFSSSRAGNTHGADNLFYSRRLGKNPSSYPSTNEGEYVKQPENSTILGAAKLSGKTKNGWGIGILETVTSSEYAKIEGEGTSRKELVEPLTNYLVTRVQKDFNDNNSTVGGIITSTNRKLDGNLDFLHRSALTGGVDFIHRWKNRSWYVSGNGVMSRVAGSKESITRTQQSIGHLFHREEAKHLALDTSKTSLTGTGGTLRLGKQGSGNWNFETGATFRSPELELNDLGFQRLSDEIRHYTWVGYQTLKPISIFQFMNVNYKHWVATDFSGGLNQVTTSINSNFMFKNNWFLSTGTTIMPYTSSTTELWGGPRVRRAASADAYLYIGSDRRKKLNVSGVIAGDVAQENAVDVLYTELNLNYQPLNTLSLSVQSNFTKFTNKQQYVTQVENEGKTDYIAATIQQKTLGVALRLNYTINPNLSVQYYGQPFISTGRYSDFKYITNPGANTLAKRVSMIGDDQIAFNEEEGIYTIQANDPKGEEFTIGNPDFAFVQYRSNLVLRWEYIPGSEFFLVWSQGAGGMGDPKDGMFRSLNQQVFSKKVPNTFLMKLTYRLQR